MTAFVLKESGLHRGRVIGSGTSLDTARFRYLISEAFELDVADVSAYVLGGHGDSQVLVWSGVTIGGIPLDIYEEQMEKSLKGCDRGAHEKRRRRDYSRKGCYILRRRHGCI